MKTKKADKRTEDKGEVDIAITKGGIHIHFANTPRWAVVLMSIGVMFFLIFIGHAIFSYYHGRSIDKMAEKIVKDEPLTKDDVKFIENLSDEEKSTLKKDVQEKISIEIGDMRMEQRAAPGTKLTIEKDGDKTSITKGGH